MLFVNNTIVWPSSCLLEGPAPTYDLYIGSHLNMFPFERKNRNTYTDIKENCFVIYTRNSILVVYHVNS